MPIQAKQIQYHYPKGPNVLDDLSCTIEPGGITAILGPNGSGKSTLIRLLAGLRKPSQGQIFIDQDPIGSLNPHQRAQSIAFIEQRPQLAFDFTIQRVVSFGGYTQPVSSDRVDQALDIFELMDLKLTNYGHLSVGQQQRVSLARAWVQIADHPNGYLLADEPCSAMDPKHVVHSMAQLKALTQSGIGVGIVMHDLNAIMQWADRVIVLDQCGAIESSGTIEYALTEQVLSKVFELPIRLHMLETGQSVFVTQG